MVLVSKANRRKIHEYLLREGVVVVKKVSGAQQLMPVKDPYLPTHQNIPGVANLEVMMVVRTLKSKDCLEETFCWQWGYYNLTNKGVKALAKSLGKSR